ncbi:MAG: FtsX-like permease family protein [Streptosporangiaceae bacterium]
MVRYLWGGLQHRVGRTVALLLGVLVATASFVVLTGAARTTQLVTVGKVGANYRSAYDILVRPKGSVTGLERSRGLVRPNYLSGIFGGISLAQYHAVANLPGVQVAAPIAMIGYIMPRVYLWVPVPANLDGAARQLYRIDPTWVFDRGLSRARDASDFAYVTGSPVTGSGEIGPDGLVSSEQVAGHSVPVCEQYSLQQAPGPFTVNVRSFMDCSGSGTTGPPGVEIIMSFPLLLAAIDPVAEARLVGLDQAVVSGRYLRPGDAAAVVSHGGYAGLTIPVLSPIRPYLDEQVRLKVWRLPPAAARAVLHAPLTNATAQQRFGAVPGTLVSQTVLTATEVYRMALAQSQRTSSGTTSYSGIDSVWTPGPVDYTVLPDGALRPRTVTNPPSIWATPTYPGGYLPVPLDAADVQFRTLTAHPFGSTVANSPVVDSVGQFDPDRLPGFSALSAVPLETYAPPVAAPGNPAASRALGGQDLLPSSNMGGYLQEPPLLLTTLAALPAIAEAFPGAVPADPISAIRVRVAGVHGVDALSRARVNAVATEIAARTGLDVDVTVGSSPAPQQVVLPAGRFGRPALVLREGWSKKGVAVAILDAVDRTSVLLFTLILVVCALFAANAASAAVRARRTELGVLACLGWRADQLFTAVLTEMGVIGLVAGIAGAALALPVSAGFGLAASPARAALAVPAATLLTLLAGIGPAWRAARSHPAAAVHPPVLPVRSARTPRGLTGLAVTNLLRTPGRTLLGALSLAIGICALTLLLAFTLAFRGQVVGTLLGNAIAVQTRPVDYISALVTVLIGAFAVADVLYLNIRERSAELAALRALGWRQRTLGRLITLEGAGMGLAGSIPGAAAGLAAAAVFTGSLPAQLFTAAIASVIAGTLIATLAAVLPASLLGRMTTAAALAEE